MFKTYQQLEHFDCGITCIRMIARFYGKRVPLSWLREKCDVSRLGVSIKGIIDCLRAMGFDAALARANLYEAERMPLPAILYWDQCHFVVLHGISRDGQTFHVADPARGDVRITREEFARHWIADTKYGLAVVVDATEESDSRTYPQEPSSLLKLAKFIGRYACTFKKAFVVAVALCQLTVAADIFLPILLQHTIDDGIGARSVHLVWMLVFGQLAVAAGQYGANCVSNLLLTRVGLKAGIQLTQSHLERLIRRPMAFFERKVSSDLLQKLTDIDRLRGYLIALPDMLFFTLFSFVVFSAMLLWYSWPVYLFILAFTALSFGWNQLFMRKRRETDYATAAYESENRNLLYELVNGMAEVKAHHAQDVRVSEWKCVQNHLNSTLWKGTLVNLYSQSGSTFFNQLRDVCITGICATLVIRQHLTFGEMMTISYLAGRLTQPVANLITSVNQTQSTMMSYERLAEIMENNEATPTEAASVSLPTLDIRLHDVWFKYPGTTSPYILSGVTIHIPHHKITAIVGESGSGKSTLLKLLLGFYPPTQGRITVGDVNLRDIPQQQWLAQCESVMQDGMLFSCSILRNIAFSAAKPDLERAREAARAACIDAFIDSLPMGYHTLLGTAGLTLSGGQRQRILIARALYSNPPMLLLDEATSSLDANNERTILQRILTSGTGRTIVVAAHRLSTIRQADNIIVMHNGQVAEQGTHADLMALHGLYYELLQKQELGGDDLSSANG